MSTSKSVVASIALAMLILSTWALWMLPTTALLVIWCRYIIRYIHVVCT